MKVLLIHNFYQQAGGEDQVFAAEARLLEEKGHSVVRYTVHNDDIREYSSSRLARATLWNPRTYKSLRDVVKKTQPDVAHFHNTFPLISPGGYYAVQAHGVPVVQTLHNFRLFCLNATFFRNGRVCEDCTHTSFPWPGIKHACYRDNVLPSSGLAAMLIIHRLAKTWIRKINVFIALTEFSRQKFISCGLPEEKIVVKENFISFDPGYKKESAGLYALYVGRLSPEKGLDILLEGWEKLKTTSYQLKIVGTGPLAEKVAQYANRNKSIQWYGQRTREEIFEFMKGARVLVFPSMWYENLPMVIIEAYAVGLPILASNLGNMSSLVSNRETGIHFQPGDAEDLAQKVEWIFSNPEQLSKMRKKCRETYEEKYTATINYQNLLTVYQRARASISHST